MKIEKSTHYSVTYKDQEYIRFDNDCWYQYYGSSLEPVSDCSELDKVFMDRKDEYKDLNRCVCSNCGDVHTTHDRVSYTK